jgi:transposase
MLCGFSQENKLKKGGVIMSYIGVDLHSDKFTVAFRNKRNEDTLKSYYIDKNEIDNFKRSLKKDDYIFIEASTPTFAFTDLLKDMVKRTIVIDPFKFKAIADSRKKTDKIDARQLAKMGKYHIEGDKKFLPEVYVVEKRIRKLRSLFTTFRLIKREINMNKNRIHSLFKQNLKPYSKKHIFNEIMTGLKPIDLEKEYKIQVEVLFEVLSKIEEKKAELKEKILLTGESFIPDIDILVSISGISVFVALGLISDYATIERFQNAKQFSKYLRSTPKSEESNKKIKTGKTQKNGRKLSIELMLQSINHFRRESLFIDKFYRKLKKGKGGCKSRIAVVRKMFVAIYFMLREREYYRYMNNKLHDKKMRKYRRFLAKNKYGG